MPDLTKQLQSAEELTPELFGLIIKELKPAFWEYQDANQLVVTEARGRMITLISVDAWESAVLALVKEVLPGWRFEVCRWRPDRWTIKWLNPESGCWYLHHHKSPAIALVLALLSAAAVEGSDA